jgi:hypothetical protein
MANPDLLNEISRSGNAGCQTVRMQNLKKNGKNMKKYEKYAKIRKNMKNMDKYEKI